MSARGCVPVPSGSKARQRLRAAKLTIISRKNMPLSDAVGLIVF